jgi:CheY-like chemotaxis protein
MAERRPKILVVEDEAVVLHTLQLVLKQNGYDVCGVRDGNEAFAVAPAFAPDVLLCDINLPGIDGITVSQRLKHEIPQIRVVLLSGEISSAELLEDARRSGYHFEVLAKPAEPQQLLRVLAGAKARHTDPHGIHLVK